MALFPPSLFHTISYYPAFVNTRTANTWSFIHSFIRYSLHRLLC